MESPEIPGRFIQWCTGKRGHHRYLDLVEPTLLHEAADIIEDIRSVAIQAKHETPDDRDPLRLDAVDRGFVRVDLLPFPVPVELDAFQPCSGQALEPDENLCAPCVVHE